MPTMAPTEVQQSRNTETLQLNLPALLRSRGAFVSRTPFNQLREASANIGSFSDIGKILCFSLPRCMIFKYCKHACVTMHVPVMSHRHVDLRNGIPVRSDARNSAAQHHVQGLKKCQCLRLCARSNVDRRRRRTRQSAHQVSALSFPRRSTDGARFLKIQLNPGRLCCFIIIIIISCLENDILLIQSWQEVSFRVTCSTVFFVVFFRTIEGLLGSAMRNIFRGSHASALQGLVMARLHTQTGQRDIFPLTGD